MKEFKQLPPAYSLGIQNIDIQHAKIINVLEDASKAKHFSGLDREKIINDILIELKTYASTHFQYEENLMKTINFDDFENHIRYHRTFISKIVEFQKNPDRYNEKKIKELAVFLKDWFLEHINKIDRQYMAMYIMYKNSQESEKSNLK